MTKPNKMGAPIRALALSSLTYDPNTGSLTWRANGARAGSVTGAGYLRVRLGGGTYAAHRLAWLMVYGADPRGVLDHRNCDRLDNRIANLREATVLENNRNCRARSCNTTGFKGVSFDKRCTKRPWRASIAVLRRDVHLGNFATAQEAHLAYVSAAKTYFGEFARVG